MTEQSYPPSRHGSHTVSYPSDREIVHVRYFDAPLALVFGALTTPEHVRRWGATGGDVMTVCDIDLRVDGGFRYVLKTPTGRLCTFEGTYLELDPPYRVVSTWHFDGWPDAWAVATDSLQEIEGVTMLQSRLTFRDAAGAAHMIRAHERSRESGDDNGQGASYDALEDLLRELR